MLIRFWTEVWFKTEFKTWFKRKDKVIHCHPMCIGSDEERGLVAWHQAAGTSEDAGDDDKTVVMTTYDVPWITPVIRSSRWTRYVPVCSTFNGFNCTVKCRSSATPDSATDV